MVGDETRLVVDRANQRTITESMLIRQAISSVLSTEGGKAFNEAIEDLNGD